MYLIKLKNILCCIIARYFHKVNLSPLARHVFIRTGVCGTNHDGVYITQALRAQCIPQVETDGGG